MNNQIKFNGSSKPTLGVELELFTVDSNSFELINGAPSILSNFKDNFFFKEELLQCIVEITTDICNNVDEIYDDLRPKLDMAIDYSNKNNIELLSMPIHPFSRVADQSVSDNPRYLSFLDRMQWPLRRLLITGIHVHVGVESGEKAIAIVNGMKRYIPFLIALSANSPYFEGENTGLASTRTKIFEGLPNTGIPVPLTNYSEFQKFMRTMVGAKSIESIREIWWDIRPHPGYGTVEIRVCDSIPNLNHIKDLTAFIQALVVGLSKHYDNGTQLSYLDSWIIYENKWRATRYGLDASLIIDANGEQVEIKELIKDTISNLKSEIEDLRVEDSINQLLFRLENGESYYKSQIKLFRNNNDFKEVISNNIAELKK
tara:strand:- start:6011 stop:7126 length:1116 start_codon:yes stop_codon:yes gene_type:complete